MADDKSNEAMPILPTDGELLMRFRLHADEQAFAELMRKHAPLVMAVCRKVLVSQADAEDVFQATFLTLVRRATTVRQKNSLASWLHQIAYRLSLNYAKQKKRRREEMLSGEESILNDELEAISERSLHIALHEELARLPETYRGPLVLCYLEEKSRSEAADELECTEASIKARLARGKRLLRKRLMFRGLTLSAVMTAVVASLKPTGAVAAGWAPLLESTTCCCATLARTGTTTGLDAHVLSIVNQGVRTMVLTSTTKISLALAAGLMVAVTGLSATIKADNGGRAGGGVLTVNIDTNTATGDLSDAVPMTVTSLASDEQESSGTTLSTVQPRVVETEADVPPDSNPLTFDEHTPNSLQDTINDPFSQNTINEPLPAVNNYLGALPDTERLTEAIRLEADALELRVEANALDSEAAGILAEMDKLRAQYEQLAEQIAEIKRTAGELETQAQQLRGIYPSDSPYGGVSPYTPASIFRPSRSYATPRDATPNTQPRPSSDAPAPH